MGAERTLKIATRASQLALWQAEQVRALLQAAHPALQVELLPMTTKGDQILNSPLAKIGGKGLFVKELEQAMLAGEADLAVHSMKDVPVELPEGLGMHAILRREDPADALVSNHYRSVEDLPQGASVGTSSLRRVCQLRQHRPDLKILDLRGNVNTRLAKLDAGEYDAIILAAAGLKRLTFEARITERLSYQRSLPAIGQGAIGVECRDDDAQLRDWLQALHHEPTAICVRAERALNEHLNGGCQVPIAGFATLDGQGADSLRLQALVGATDGSVMYQADRNAEPGQAQVLGVGVAEDLLAQGAGQVLGALGL